MGNTIFRKMWSNQDVRLLVNGLDSAGKSTVLFQMKLGDMTLTLPTIGFNVKTLHSNDILVHSWDTGGRDKIKSLWRSFYENMSGIVWVVDSNDHVRIGATAKELKITMEYEDQLKGCPLLVLANKQDLAQALSVAELTDQLGLSTLKDREWHVQACCATSGEGLREGFEWLSSALARKSAAQAASDAPPPLAYLLSVFRREQTGPVTLVTPEAVEATVKWKQLK